MKFKRGEEVIMKYELPISAWPTNDYYNDFGEKNPNIPKIGDVGKILKVNGGGWLSIRFENSNKNFKIRNGKHFKMFICWRVTIPPKVKPGDRFVVLLGKQAVGLVCPDNIGQEFEKKRMAVPSKDIRKQALSMERGSMDVWQWVAQ